MMGYAGEADKAIFKDDGKVNLVLYGSYQQSGTYSLEEGEICFQLPNLSYCEQVFIENGKYYVLDRNGKRKGVLILNWLRSAVQTNSINAIDLKCKRRNNN